MKEPKFGANKIQSFIDFDYASGNFRLGAEGKQLFVEIEETKWFITSTAGATLADVVSERTVGAGVTIDGVLLKDNYCYVSLTDAVGGGYGIKVLNTFTKTGALSHKAILSDLTYDPAITGAACPIAIVGKVTIDGNCTEALDAYPGLGIGIQGQIHIANGSIIDGIGGGEPGAIYTGVRGVVTNAGTSTYTRGFITAGYFETQMNQNVSAGNFKHYIMWLRAQGSGTCSGIDAALRIDSNSAFTDKIVSAIDISACITTEILKVADDGTVCHDTDAHAIGKCDISDFVGFIKVKVGTAVRYIWLSDTIPSAGDVVA